MRRALLSAVLPLLLAACGGEAPEPENGGAAAAPPTEATEIYASGPRDRLCLKPSERRVGVITYAASGDSNCALRGTMAEPFEIRPDGDERCTLSYSRNSGVITLSQVGAACGYYCGPGASLEGKIFAKVVKPDKANDLAGDPLC